ncbi:MAG: type IX secretion system outer membrane channel protein PorV [Bacteroidota bacterium]|nr:MAG: type IX secretion system outer membrane channel protein PorV [Bacteroidota bacterium]
MIKQIFALGLSVCVGLTYTIAQDSNGQEISNSVIRTSVPFLTIAPDSKAGAMGDAGVSTSGDLSSQHWNSAKYVTLKENFGLALSYTPWLRSLGVTDLNLLYLSGYKKFGRDQAVSASLRYFNLGEIIELDGVGNETGQTIRPNEFALDAGYSRAFSEYFNGGLVFRFIYSDIAAGTSSTGLAGGAQYEPGTSFAADISTYFQKPVNVGGYDASYAWGVNISNIGTKMTYSEDNESQFIPTNLRVGGRYEMEIDEYNSIGGTLDLNKLLVPLNDTTNMGTIEGMFKSFSDAPGGFKEEMQEIMWSFGLEYMYMKQFAIRAGYFHENENKGNRKYFTAGVGLYLNVFSLDFSYLFPTQGGQNNPLSNTMRFTLGFKFE